MLYRFLHRSVAGCGLLLALWLPAAAQNTWTARAPLPVPGRETAATFELNGFGYLVGGWVNPTDVRNDLWRYDPASNTWSQLADLPVAGRHNAVGMAIGNRGYMGTGRDSLNTRLRDWWAFNPDSNTWRRRANFPGPVRAHACGFAIDSLGYLGAGYSGTTELLDFYAYSPATNSWTARARYPSDARTHASTFTLAGRGYVVGGYNGFTSVASAQTWAFNPDSNAWHRCANLPAPRMTAVTWALGDAGYAGAGLQNPNGPAFGDFWRYNPITNGWSAVAPFGGGTSGWASGFALNGKGYLVGGSPTGAPSPSSALWEYVPPNPMGAATGLPSLLPRCWPNPTNGILYVTGSLLTAEARLYGGQGQLVRTWPAAAQGRLMLDLSGLPTGTYWLQARGGATQWVVLTP